MTKLQHTPGPWKIDRFSGSICAGYATIATDIDNKADARLIAAAPSLLAALREMLAYDDDPPAAGTYGAEVYARARIAIAKATGTTGMQRPFRVTDNGKRFRMNNPQSKFHSLIGELEFPLTDPGSAEADEGILWFGPADDRHGWDYVKPSQVKACR